MRGRGSSAAIATVNPKKWEKTKTAISFFDAKKALPKQGFR
jgi:hypothetical protein